MTVDRELLTLNRKEVLGNFTFGYLCRFFFVHLLSPFLGDIIVIVHNLIAVLSTRQRQEHDIDQDDQELQQFPIL
ncbi:hypothetical protein [Dolichospermum planctonicum]|uniref:Uncharacterized protein n=2 Tax=Dolichospermum TaxID=748770 RepID=A0A480AA94_9CYAN|nr:hypothetical protein [Dolichospermum planctonicum]MBE9220767.1 hypothetical protein [Dolichospermum flos-aquae LEGE 04289]GCL40856.1 hypothetical protein NIES80_05460 [Dolichospermum planctonicum]